MVDAQRNLMWIARYQGRLLYIPHENIEIIISNLDYTGRPIPNMPIRLFRMTHENEATYIDILPNEDSMEGLLSRVIDLGGIVEYSEDARRQQAEAYQQRLEQQGGIIEIEKEPEQTTAPVPKGERTISAFPDPIPPSREEAAVAEAAAWDENDPQMAGAVTDQAAQQLIEEVTPVPPPKADKVRKRNGNRR